MRKYIRREKNISGLTKNMDFFFFFLDDMHVLLILNVARFSAPMHQCKVAHLGLISNREKPRRNGYTILLLCTCFCGKVI